MRSRSFEKESGPEERDEREKAERWLITVAVRELVW
jgi:hypothetical protein